MKMKALVSWIALASASLTTAIAETLTVEGDLDVSGQLTVGSSATTPVEGTIRYGDDGSGNNVFQGYDGSSWKSLTTGENSSSLFDPGGSEVVTVDTEGNVGIGNQSPSAELDLVGDLILSGDVTVGGNITGPNSYLDTFPMVISTGYYSPPFSDFRYGNDLTLRSGDGRVGPGGKIMIESGSSAQGTSGEIEIFTGSSGFVSGGVSLRTGSVSYFDSGEINLQTGSAPDPGSVRISAGDATPSPFVSGPPSAGDILIDGGMNLGGPTDSSGQPIDLRGGNVVITSGGVPNNPTGRGGDIQLNAVDGGRVVVSGNLVLDVDPTNTDETAGAIRFDGDFWGYKNDTEEWVSLTSGSGGSSSPATNLVQPGTSDQKIYVDASGAVLLSEAQGDISMGSFGVN
ncbi:MAG: hypothetical protein AAF546_10220 [Verrucomicrobiota bacterium]